MTLAATSRLVDYVKMTTETVGAGSIALLSAVPGFRGAEALLDGATYSYALAQPTGEWEVGMGLYDASLGTLTRSPLYSSSNGTPIALSGRGVVTFTALASDIAIPSFETPFNAVGNGVADDAVALSNALNSDLPFILGTPGASYLIDATVIPVSGFILDVQNSSITVDWNGSEILIKWNPLLPGSTADCIRLLECVGIKFKRTVIRYDPPLSIMATVISVDAARKFFDVLPVIPPQFISMNAFIRYAYDPIYSVWEVTNVNYDTSNIDPNTPDDPSFPIVIVGTGPNYRVTPPFHIENITGVISMNPLTFQLDANHFLQRGDAVIPRSVGGLLHNGVSDINGVTCYADPNGSNDTFKLQFIPGNDIDASTWTAYTSGGTIENVPVDPWVGINDLLALSCRKRMSNPLFFRRCVEPELDFTFYGAAATAVLGNDNTGGKYKIRAYPENGGLLAICAGGTFVGDTRGEVEIDAQIFGSGDDQINFYSTGFTVTAFTSTTLTNTVVATDGKSNATAPSRVGDWHEFWDPNSVLQKSMLVTDASTFGPIVGLTRSQTVSYGADTLPGGFDPATWYVINRSLVATMRYIAPVNFRSGAHGIVNQSHDSEIIGGWKSRGGHNNSLKARGPFVVAGRKTGGFKGGFKWDVIDFVRNGFDQTLNDFANLNFLAQKRDGSTATGAAFLMSAGAMTFIAGYGYAAVSDQGCPVNVGNLVLADGGALRFGPGTNPRNQDVYYEQCRLVAAGYDNRNGSPAELGGTGGVFVKPVTAGGPPSYTLSQMLALSAGSYAGVLVIVTDVGVGGSLWRSDGTNWRLTAEVVLAHVPKLAFNAPAGTTELTGYTYTVKAGLLGVTRSIRTRNIAWTVVASANAKTMRQRFSGNVFDSLANAGSSTTYMMSDDTIANRSAGTQQAPPGGIHDTPGSSNIGIQTSSINTAVDQDLTLTMQLAVGTEGCTIEGGEIRLVP